MSDEPLLGSFVLEQSVNKAQWSDGFEAAVSDKWKYIK